MTPFCPNNCSNSSWHAFYKVLACFFWYPIPYFHHPVPKFMHPLGMSRVFEQFPFHMYPEMLNGANVRGLGRPIKYLDVIVFKPLFGLLGGVFQVIILLKYPLLLGYLQLLKAFHHPIIQDVTVLLCIHVPLDLYKLSHPTPSHTSPYNKIISSSMLNSRSGSPV